MVTERRLRSVEVCRHARTPPLPALGPRWLALAALALVIGAAVVQPMEALAACAPATGSNITVTCSGATVNQGNGTPGGTTGYGDGTQNGLTLGVQSGASVTGSFVGPVGPPFTTATGIAVDNNNAITLQSGAQVAGVSANGATGILATDGNTITLQSGATVTGTSTGISLGANNTVNNAGTITTAAIGGVGDAYGISASGPLTVINSGTIGKADIATNAFDAAGINAFGGLSVTNKAGGVIQGSTGILGVGVGTVVNSGLINAIGGGGAAIDYSGNNTSSVTVTNNASGTITGDNFGISANAATVFNYRTISAPGFGATAVNANTLTLTNYASGVITGDGSAISGSQTPTLTVTNFGTISGGINAASGAISGDVVNVTNSGTISVAAGSGGPAVIEMASDSVTNNAGGFIIGDSNAIATEGNTTVFNAGTISAATGPAIVFAFFGGNTLTLGPGSIINGNVQGFGSDTFQLGGTGSDTFNASNIGT